MWQAKQILWWRSNPNENYQLFWLLLVVKGKQIYNWINIFALSLSPCWWYGLSVFLFWKQLFYLFAIAFMEHTDWQSNKIEPNAIHTFSNTRRDKYLLPFLDNARNNKHQDYFKFHRLLLLIDLFCHHRYYLDFSRVLSLPFPQNRWNSHEMVRMNEITKGMATYAMKWKL